MKPMPLACAFLLSFGGAWAEHEEQAVARPAGISWGSEADMPSTGWRYLSERGLYEDLWKVLPLETQRQYLSYPLAEINKAEQALSAYYRVPGILAYRNPPAMAWLAHIRSWKGDSDADALIAAIMSRAGARDRELRESVRACPDQACVQAIHGAPSYPEEQRVIAFWHSRVEADKDQKAASKEMWLKQLWWEQFQGKIHAQDPKITAEDVEMARRFLPPELAQQVEGARRAYAQERGQVVRQAGQAASRLDGAASLAQGGFNGLARVFEGATGAGIVAAPGTSAVGNQVQALGDGTRPRGGWPEPLRRLLGGPGAPPPPSALTEVEMTRRRHELAVTPRDKLFDELASRVQTRGARPEEVEAVRRTLREDFKDLDHGVLIETLLRLRSINVFGASTNYTCRGDEGQSYARYEREALAQADPVESARLLMELRRCANRGITLGEFPETAHLQSRNTGDGRSWSTVGGVSDHHRGIVAIAGVNCSKDPARNVWQNPKYRHMHARPCYVATHELAHMFADLGLPASAQGNFWERFGLWTDRKSQAEIERVFSEYAARCCATEYCKGNKHEFVAETMSVWACRISPESGGVLRDARWLQAQCGEVAELMRSLFGPPRACPP